MKVKMLGLAAMAAMALMAFLGASTASATELYSEGSTLNAGSEISVTLAPETTAQLTTTGASPIDTCTESTVAGKTSNTEGAQVAGTIETLTWGGCSATTHTDAGGSLSIASTSGNNGTVTGSGSTVTVTFSGVVCLYGTGGGTHLGTLTGVPIGQATIDINAVVNEQGTKKILCPDTTIWNAEYLATNPEGLTVEPPAAEKVAVELIIPAFKAGEWFDVEAKNTGNVEWKVVNEGFEVEGEETWKIGESGCEPNARKPNKICSRELTCIVKGNKLKWELTVKAKTEKETEVKAEKAMEC